MPPNTVVEYGADGAPATKTIVAAAASSASDLIPSLTTTLGIVLLLGSSLA